MQGVLFLKIISFFIYSLGNYNNVIYPYRLSIHGPENRLSFSNPTKKKKANEDTGRKFKEVDAIWCEKRTDKDL